jgi:NDP-sugar pyrophosphorylase family protein
VNGDSLCRAPLEALWAWHTAERPAATLLLARVRDAGRYGRVRVGRNGRVVAFEEKRPEVGPAWVSAGVYLLGRELLESVPPGRFASLERDVFPRWVGRGLAAWRVAAPFIDIGTPDAWAAAGEFLARHPSHA